jgi:hypothetical protein
VKSKLSPKQAQNMLNFAVKGLAPARNAQSIVTKGVEVLGIGQPLNATLVSERLAWHPNYLISYQQLPYQEDSRAQLADHPHYSFPSLPSESTLAIIL